MKNLYRNTVQIEHIEPGFLWERKEIEGIDCCVLVDDDDFVVIKFDTDKFTEVENN